MHANESPIGVFDSGIGGLSILRALQQALPAERFVYYADSGNAPYGERGEAFVAQRSMAVTRELIAAHGAKLVVVACNTATAAAIASLRDAWPTVPMVGVEPALKPAALASRTSRVAVFATRGTLASARLAVLRSALPASTDVVLQACDGLAAAIEAGDDEGVEALCEAYLRAAGAFGAEPGQIDTLVLGCTHYTFALPALRRRLGPEVRIIDTGEPVARQTQRVLSERGLLREAGGQDAALVLAGTGSAPELRQAAQRWLA
ncbi:MAG TPA: glutamate racemase [Ramlibacter sp.]|nr:glutamate racemase [Ramlibacter sp.]